MARDLTYSLLCWLLCGLIAGCSSTPPVEEPKPLAGQVALSRINEPIQPIPLHIELNPQKMTLGEKLFHDPQLSRGNQVSCATCHNLATGGTDRRRRSLGVDGSEGEISAPTVFNSGFNFKQFWDGRAETLEDQTDGPINNPKEMGSNWPEVIGKLTADPYYVAAFGELYSDGIQVHNIKDAIATFERSLYTPNSRFDQYLRGDDSAITSEELEGHRIFKEHGCTRCHQGVVVGGNMFETFGTLRDYFQDRGNVTRADFGRYNVTRDEADRYKFKVPSLRNVALTPPYFHDASAPTLEMAVSTMVTYQLGRRLSDEQIKLVVKFLNTLTGEYKGKPLDSVSQ